MPLQDLDVSWQVLRRIVHEWTGTSAELEEVRPLEGGAIHQTVALTTRDGARAVLKLTAHRVDRSYQDEAYQLNLLRELGLPVPEVYLWRTGSLDDPFSFILMQFLEGMDLGEAKRRCTPDEFDHLQMHLAELTLAIHHRTAEHYGRVQADENAQQHERWPVFYRQIFDAIWRETEKSGVVPPRTRKQIARIHDRLDKLLAHDDVPRLVHWDLWATNILVHPDAHGRWSVSGILDPMCKFAHVETELAYLELFSTINPAFLRTYQQTRKLPADYHRVRKWVYQMYPLIDHVHLFGPEYVKPLLGVVDRLSEVC